MIDLLIWLAYLNGKLAAMVPQPNYFITSPIVIEDDYTGDLGNLDSLQIHDEPSYTLSPVSFVRLPQFENAKEFDITWPFILLHSLEDVRVKFICHQIIVTTYRNEPALEEKLFNLFYAAYLTFQFELNDFLKKKGIDFKISEFSEIKNAFDWRDMASKLRSSYQ